jgi:hypothetical protein
MQKSQKDHARALPLHPLLIGLFPILSLMGHNIIEIAPEDGFRSLLVSAALVGLVWLVTRAVTRWSWARAGLAASLFAGLFFSYGHVYTLVEGASLLGLRVGRHLLLGPVWVGIFIGGVWGIRKIQDTATLTQALNLIGAVLLVFPLYQITAHELTILASESRLEGPAPVQTGTAGFDRPDIYYIILDAYTRDDTLLEVFDYDNTPFLQALEDRGFVIPHCSRSNYGRTYLSISSSLNMGYVQDFAPYNGPGELTAMIKDSAVRQAFTAEGYTIVAFDADFYRTQWPDADLYIAYESRGGGLRKVNEFEALATDTTALFFLLDANLVLGGSPLEFVYETRNVEKYNRVNFTFDTLEDFPATPGPKFVWVHIPSPHGPYVFSETGRYFPDLDETPEGYRAQVIYLNQRVLDAVDAILARSEIPPVIVVQGDHGAEDTYGDYRRLNILNAYYLPGEESGRLYPSITPVNTFRLILDTYFDDEMDLLPDVSYFCPRE